MLPLMSKVAAFLLLNASTIINPIPTTPKALSFDASAYVTINHEIRVAVEKTAEASVVILLRNKNNRILYQQNVSKKDTKYAVKLNVDELADGQYELEVKSAEGSIRRQLNVSTPPVQQTNRTIAMQ